MSLDWHAGNAGGRLSGGIDSDMSGNGWPAVAESGLASGARSHASRSRLDRLRGVPALLGESRYAESGSA